MASRSRCINCSGTGYLDEGADKRPHPCQSCSWRVGLYPLSSWSVSRKARHKKLREAWIKRVEADYQKRGKVLS